MALLKFSLSPEATVRIHDLLLCLAKFGDSVCLEARSDRVSIGVEGMSTGFLCLIV